MSCLNGIFKMLPDKDCVQGEKKTGGKGCEGSFQVNQHPTGFIGNADVIIFSTEPGVLDNCHVFNFGNIWYCLDTGLFIGRKCYECEDARFWWGCGPASNLWNRWRGCLGSFGECNRGYVRR